MQIYRSKPFNPAPLRRWREQEEVSQKDMGDLIGVSQGFYAELERGKKTPGLGTFARIVELTEINPLDLLRKDWE